MTKRDTTSGDFPSYNAPARALHWIMAAMIVAILFVGVAMVSISSSERQTLIAVHKSLGVLMLVLGLIRVAWRLANPPPKPSRSEPFWRRRVAHATHCIFYLMFFAMPLLGWAMQSAGGYPTSVFGGLQLPPLAPQIGELHAQLRLAHKGGAYALYGLFLLHMSAALFHALILEDGTLKRMKVW